MWPRGFSISVEVKQHDTQCQNFHFPGPNLIALSFMMLVSFCFCLCRVFSFYHPLMAAFIKSASDDTNLLFFWGGGLNINQVCDTRIYLLRYISVQWKLLQDNVVMNKK